MLFGTSLFVLMVMTGLANAPADQVAADGQASPLGGGTFHRVQLADAAAWLASATGPDDVVLADLPTGNLIGGVIPGRVFVGHSVATLRSAEKERAARRFFGEADDEERRRFLASNRIRYVVYGPYERALAMALPLESSGLGPVYRNAEVVIYRIDLAERPQVESRGITFPELSPLSLMRRREASVRPLDRRTSEGNET